MPGASFRHGSAPAEAIVALAGGAHGGAQAIVESEICGGHIARLAPRDHGLFVGDFGIVNPDFNGAYLVAEQIVGRQGTDKSVARAGKGNGLHPLDGLQHNVARRGEFTTQSPGIGPIGTFGPSRCIQGE